jgi:hypothetical protein
MLDRNGLGHHTEPGAISGYEVTIWPMPEKTENPSA